MAHVAVLPDQINSWPTLLPIADQKDKPRFAIEGTSWIAGSLPQSHIQLKSRLVSKSHALIVNDLGESYVRDLGSTNGVYLNNQPVREARLTSGDILNIGRFQFICYGGFPTDEDEPPQEVYDAELQVEGTDKVAVVRLRSLVIGRRDRCDLKLDDPEVSQVHAIVYRCDGRRFIRDLNSKNGTFLNHQRIRDAEIRPGDMVQVGGTIIRYERTEESLRGFIPDVAAEQASPLRLADDDEGTLDPMTDSALELALKATEDMQITAEPAPKRKKKKKKKKGVVLDPTNQAHIPKDDSFETVAELLADVDAGGMPSNLLDSLESVWDEGPTSSNVDLPQGSKPEKSEEQVADLLEDGFFRGAGL